MHPTQHRPSDYDFDVIAGPAAPPRPSPSEQAAPASRGPDAPTTRPAEPTAQAR